MRVFVRRLNLVRWLFFFGISVVHLIPQWDGGWLVTSVDIGVVILVPLWQLCLYSFFFVEMDACGTPPVTGCL